MADDDTQVVKSSRSPEELRARLQDWLILRTTDPNATIGRVTSPEANGMSSESLFFDAAWNGRSGSFVARLAPSPDDVPVFRRYDLELQYEVMELVRGRSTVPVPPLRWLETNPAHLDVPFFVMERIDGRVPADLPPYATGGWICDLGDDGRGDLERRSIDLLAKIHAIDITDGAADFLHYDQPGATALRRHFADQREYYEWVCDGSEMRYPTIERAHEWLETNWPTNEGDPVISWGDSRIGNVMYDPEGTAPVAVLDWEMAGVAPRALDVGWMCFMHLFFEYLLGLGGVPTLPDMLRPDNVREQYREMTGVDVGDLRFELVYNAARHATIMARLHSRHVHFGTAEPPADADDAWLFKGLLDELMSD